MNKKWIYTILVVAIVVVLTLIAEISGIFRTNDVITIEITEGSGISTICSQLKDKGVITSKSLFLLCSKFSGATYHMGVHKFSSKSYPSIIEELSTPTQANAVNITITEGMEQREIAKLLEQNGLVNASEFNAAAKIDNYDYWFLKGVKKRDMELEGYLFPDTYEFAYDESAESIIAKMLNAILLFFPIMFLSL